MDTNGDYVVGAPFLVDSPELVSQLIRTRLRLWEGEWFADTSEGTPYETEVLGERYGKNPDAAIRQRILGTPGVTELLAYSGSFDGSTRKYTVSAKVQTQFSDTPIDISEALPA